MTLRVEIAFDLAANGVGSFFTLDDPAKGALDNATFTLAGDVLVDVTDRVRRVQVKRGRSRTLERTVAGTCQIELDNRDRAFDPLNAASPYFGSITPRKQFRVSKDSAPVWTGNVEDWSWDYDLNGDAVATAQGVDGFAVLANVNVTPGTEVAGLTGARVGTVLTDAGWPETQRSLSAGQSSIDDDVVVDGTNVLQYLEKVAVSDPGIIFIAKDGSFAYRDRADLQDPTSGGVTFGPGAGQVPFVDYQAASVTEELRNAVEVTWYGGTAIAGTAVASDATSQASYGVFDYKVDTLLDTAEQAQQLADWLVATYKDPTYRIDRIGVVLEALDAAQRASVLDLELGDVVTVTWTPNGVGSAITQTVSIDQIEHAADPQQHRVTFTLSQSSAGFVLDDLAFGVLDTSRLGF